MKNEACPLEECVNGDEDLAVCRDVDDSSWESTFFATLGQEPEEASEDEQEHFFGVQGAYKGGNNCRICSRQGVRFSTGSDQTDHPQLLAQQCIDDFSKLW